MAPESRDEVRQRIDSLYEQAENATGNYNATRAMSAATRTRGVPLAKRSGRGPDPALDAMARQWFDVARAKLGPTVPAALPADRRPAGPATPPRPRDRTEAGAREALSVGLPELPPGSGSRPADRALPALPAGASTDRNGRPRLALEAGATGASDDGRPMQLGRPVAELPGAGAPGPAATPGRGIPELTGGGTAVLPVAAPPAALGTPVQAPRELPGSADAPRRPSPAEFKANNRRRLAAAREVLSRYTTELATPAALPSAQGAWNTGAQQVSEQAGRLSPEQPGQLDTGQWQQPQWAPPVGVPNPNGVTPLTTTDTGSFAPPTANPLTDTGSFAPPTNAPTYTATFAPPAPNPLSDSGAFAPLTVNPLTDTGSFPPLTTNAPIYTAAFAPPAPNPLSDSGSFAPLTVNPLTDTGSFIPTAAAPTADTGSFARVPSTPESSRALRAEKAIAFARAQIGKPCVWGATGPDSYDCSSLVGAAWKAAGVTLPRAAHQLALAGTPVTLAGLEPGDLLLFFDDDRHVGLYVGNGTMVHAPGPGSYIREESIYGAGEAAIHRVIRPA